MRKTIEQAREDADRMRRANRVGWTQALAAVREAVASLKYATEYADPNYMAGFHDGLTLLDDWVEDQITELEKM